jgi:hypothetical protein
MCSIGLAFSGILFISNFVEFGPLVSKLRWTHTHTHTQTHTHTHTDTHTHTHTHRRKTEL